MFMCRLFPHRDDKQFTADQLFPYRDDKQPTTDRLFPHRVDKQLTAARLFPHINNSSKLTLTLDVAFSLIPVPKYLLSPQLGVRK